jgi:branched-chain amino acid transport system substrate-binding protein
MKSNPKRTFAKACLATALAAVTAWPLLAQAQSDIVLGAALPITGPFAASGLPGYNALKLAQEDINAAGGINGKKVRIVFEDTAANNSAAVNAYIKLVKQHNPAFVFLSNLSMQVMATEPEIAKAKIPGVTPGGAMALEARKNPYIFRSRPADVLGAGALAWGITEQLKKSKVGILYTQDDYGTGSANALEELLKKQGVSVVAKEGYNARDNDFSPQLLNAKNKGADVLVTFNYNRDGALILKQRKSLGIDIPLVSGAGMASPGTLDLVEAADMANVLVAADAVLGEEVSPASAEFVRRYVINYKMRPDSFGASYYDAAMMVADGLRKVGTDPEKLRAHMAGIKGYKGVTRVYTTDAATGNMAHAVTMATFKPGSKELQGIATYPKK